MNAALRPSHGLSPNMPGSKHRGCKAQDPPASATAFHRLLFSPHSAVDWTLREETCGKAVRFDKKAIRKVIKAKRRFDVPVDIDRLDHIIAEHMMAMAQAELSSDDVVVDQVGGASAVGDDKSHCLVDSSASAPSPMPSANGLANMCLPEALRALGAQVTVDVPGPFRALKNGNAWLEPLGLQLHHCRRPVIVSGRFVVWQEGAQQSQNHFIAVIVENGVCTTHSRGVTLRGLCPEQAEGPFSNRWFRLSARLSDEQSARIAANRAAALAKRAARSAATSPRPRADSLAPAQQEVADDITWAKSRRQLALPAPPRFHESVRLSEEQRARIDANRADALKRRTMSLTRPLPPASWETPSMPSRPEDIMSWTMDLPQLTFLSFLSAHPRDRHVAFYADSHTYIVRGRRTLGSVTGLVHQFANPFDAPTIIERMVSGRNWPRPGS